jgi:hypothetical protein
MSLDSFFTTQTDVGTIDPACVCCYSVLLLVEHESSSISLQRLAMD